MCTHHSAGALPLGVWITSGQSQHVTKQCLEKLQNVLPLHAFGTRGPKMGPQIFMTDDDQGQRGALSDIWKECQLLLSALFTFFKLSGTGYSMQTTTSTKTIANI